MCFLADQQVGFIQSADDAASSSTQSCSLTNYVIRPESGFETFRSYVLRGNDAELALSVPHVLLVHLHCTTHEVNEQYCSVRFAFTHYYTDAIYNRVQKSPSLASSGP